METLIFFIVDVFTEEKYAGNQLAVIRDAKQLSDKEMQKIAKEMNYSETTFILSDERRDGGYDVRIFTPETELPFAGHPTLGTAYVIQREIVKKPIDKIVLNLKVGRIPVSLSYIEGNVDILWMKQLQPTFGQIFDAESISQVLGLGARDMDNGFPIQEVSTGVPDIIVPLKNLDAVKRARIVRDKYFELIKDIQAKAILIFCPETYSQENDLNVRFFADYFGVPEDPATGSANGCLAGYLVKHRYFRKDRINIRVEQGYEIGRPSLLLLRAESREGKIDVFVGGKVIMTAKGELI
ncbi:MAG: PhzF family phenazine biosynthesis protein [Candidatus Bathyarchaeota archaeon]|nr:PhzF family phenazine biosynthesis protein [Candidatus Bathyarchaeota archaeon]